MSLFALIKSNAVLRVDDLPSQPANLPAKGFSWLPFVESYPVYDSALETLNAPTVTIEAARVFKTATVRLLTAQELSDRKDALVNYFPRLAFEVTFNHENRIRALEGLGAITRNQLKTALKNLL